MRSAWLEGAGELRFEGPVKGIVRAELFTDNGKRIVLRAERHIGLAILQSFIHQYAECELAESGRKPAEIVPLKRKSRRRNH